MSLDILRKNIRRIIKSPILPNVQLDIDYRHSLFSTNCCCCFLWYFNRGHPPVSRNSINYSIDAGHVTCMYSLPSIILFANIDVSRYILVVDTSVLWKSNMGRREYKYDAKTVRILYYIFNLFVLVAIEMAWLPSARKLHTYILYTQVAPLAQVGRWRACVAVGIGDHWQFGSRVFFVCARIVPSPGD
jgi:hypothetical protein